MSAVKGTRAGVWGSATPWWIASIKAASRARVAAFFLRERLLARIAGGPPLRILMSRHEGWETSIRAGFVGSQHQVFFDELTNGDLASYDMVVPLCVADTLLLDARRAELSNALLPIPGFETVLLCDDKLRLNLTLTERGFSEYIPPMLDESAAPPFILKKRIAENSEHCYIVDSESKRKSFASLESSPEYFKQQLVHGRSEYASHVLFVGGHIKSEITVEYVADRPVYIKGSEPFLAKSLGRTPFRGPFTSMLRAIGFEGLCCINYKVEDGRLRLLEINPRFGGSLAPLFFSFVRHLRRRD